MSRVVLGSCRAAAVLCLVLAGSTVPAGDEPLPLVTFPEGAATPAETCGRCHDQELDEHSRGLGGDFILRSMTFAHGPGSPGAPSHTGRPTGHAVAALTPSFVQARKTEACGGCHYPSTFSLALDPERSKPKPRPPGKRANGVTCAACHLDEHGAVRTLRPAQAPHKTKIEPRLATPEMCAVCHCLDPDLPASRYQTYREWRDEYVGRGIGRRTCQECHMPRRLARGWDQPQPKNVPRPRHLWPGGHSPRRLAESVHVCLKQADRREPLFQITIGNTSAGHRVPTGSARRGLRLKVQVFAATGRTVADHEWLMAPWAEDLVPPPTPKTPVRQTSAKPAKPRTPFPTVPSQPPLLPGEERTIHYQPDLREGRYTIRASLIFEPDRLAEPGQGPPPFEIQSALLTFMVQAD